MKFIAEIGLNHNGLEGLIYRLIKEAYNAGATYAKFQLGWRDKEGEINFLDHEKLRLILKTCDYFGIEPLFSVFHEQALSLLTSIYSPSILKVASRTYSHDKEFFMKLVNNIPDLIVSVGMEDTSDPQLPSRLHSISSTIKVLWCQSSYPLFPWDVANIPKSFDESNYIGISDHSVGISLSLLAISRGATLVERHFTLDPSEHLIRDHALSSTPEEFEHLVRIGSEIHKLSLIL